MKKYLMAAILSSISLLLMSCSRLCTVQAVGSNVEGKQINFLPTEFPCKKLSDYESAVKNTISVVFSKEFEKRLSDHIMSGIGSGEHTKAWENLTAKMIIEKMKLQLNGERISTYGGINGWWLYKIYGNIAFDGEMNGPIRLNRIPLKNRTSASIANTIAHETAHKIGLTHPHSDTNLSIAFKEPPYVIGKMIEKIIEETNYSALLKENKLSKN